MRVQIASHLRLYFRNKMAMIYGYLFPSIFLIAFWVLYRWDAIPLIRHIGELLTVTILGGACFGLPTTMVSDRERGVWRRYRLTPVSTLTVVVGMLAARYFILISAGLLQVALAVWLGMPLPKHPFDLWLAFSVVAFAFLGLGLVIATLADNVPAVQALGQCIFLPMLIIGGVAVKLESLPDWAQQLASFFPGKYAVAAIQDCVAGDGFGGFSIVALLIIGSAGCLAGGKMFRWDSQQRFSQLNGKAWVLVALAGWTAVGLMAKYPAAPEPASFPKAVKKGAPALPPTVEDRKADVPVAAIAPKTSVALSPPLAAALPEPLPPLPPSWQQVTLADIERDFIFDKLPSDTGVVTPVASILADPDPVAVEQLEVIREGLPDWPPAKVADPVQRVRNVLYIAAVIDVYQMDGLEPYVPLIVYDRLMQDVPKDDLIKILYWIASNPEGGDHKAAGELRAFGIGSGAPGDMQTTRRRVAIYAVKLIGRLTGKIIPK